MLYKEGVKMKKSYIVLTIIGIIVISIILIFVLGKINSNKDQNEEILSENVNEIYSENDILNTMQVVVTSNAGTKVTPNTVFIFKTYYDKCMHITMKKIKASEEFVNKTEEQVQIFYEDWKIEEFSKDKVVFYKEMEGICNEHYVLRDVDGYVTIYSLNENNVESLVEITDIVTVYLTDEDKELLKEGIRVIGKDNLNAAIEDYE